MSAMPAHIFDYPASFVFAKWFWLSCMPDFVAESIDYSIVEIPTQYLKEGDVPLMRIEVHKDAVPKVVGILEQGLRFEMVAKPTPRASEAPLTVRAHAADIYAFEDAVKGFKKALKKGQPRGFAPHVDILISSIPAPASFFQAPNFVWSRTA
jgi:hypothetical protein